MKRLINSISLGLIVFLVLANKLSAQDCQAPQPNNGTYLHSNNLRALFTASGSQFFDGNNGQLRVFNGNDEGIATIVANGLWLGAIDGNDEIRIATAEYGLNNGQSDYYPGPALPDGSPADPECGNYDRAWSVYGYEIEAHLADFADNGQIDQPIEAVMGWPGAGNTNFFNYYGFDLPESSDTLAPFKDLNNDGIYQPEAGEHPVEPHFETIPEQMVWTVFNTVSGPANESGTDNPIAVEVQNTSWSFYCAGNPLVLFDFINNSVFSSYRIINRDNMPLDSMRIALWTDFDIGCFLDDYVGCAPFLNTYYAYNQDNSDDVDCSSISNVIGFGVNPPVQSITFLNQPLSAFISVNSGTQIGGFPPGSVAPQSTIEYWRVMNGRFIDNSRISFGGTGYDPDAFGSTDYMFPGDPNDPDQWSAFSANIGDISGQSAIGSSGGVGSLQPGQAGQLDVVYSYHRRIGADFLGNVNRMFFRVQDLREWYSGTSPTDCPSISSCSEDCVWPGDLNADSIANHLDLIAAAFGLGATGPTRDGPHFWSPRNGEDWEGNQALGINNKHLDANGDGECTFADFEKTLLFYNQTHPEYELRDVETIGSELAFERTSANLDFSNLSLGQFVLSRIRLNTEFTNLRAVGLRLEYDPFFYSSFTPAGNSTIITDEEILYVKEIAPGMLDCAFYWEEDFPVNTDEELLRFLVTIRSNIPPILPTDTTCVSIKNIRGYLSDGTEVELGANKTTIQIDGIVSTNEAIQAERVKLYPNPVQNQLNVEFGGQLPDQIEVFDATGRRQMLSARVGASLAMGQLPKGVYYLRFRWPEGVSTYKVIKE